MFFCWVGSPKRLFSRAAFFFVTGVECMFRALLVSTASPLDGWSASAVKFLVMVESRVLIRFFIIGL